MGKDKAVILCIDDDPDILEFFQTVLGKEGHTVVTAKTGEDGLKAFKKQQPDILFVDMMMEEVDAGPTLVTNIKALGGQAPIYMVTSMGDQLNMATNYADLGVQGVLQKPVDIDNLLKLVDNALKE